MGIQTADSLQETTKLERVSKRAKFKPDTVFNNIGYVLDMDLLRECYQSLDAKKAIGIDGVTKATYGLRLEENLGPVKK